MLFALKYHSLLLLVPLLSLMDYIDPSQKKEYKSIKEQFVFFFLLLE
jgi:hypothetical protein